MNRDKAFKLINQEREHQEKLLDSGKWERMSESPMEFLADIRVYTRKCEEAFVSTGSNLKAMDYMRKIAALAVAAMEKNETPGRGW